MRIVHLSTADIAGGAARAAYRLHSGLLQLGHESTMLVLKKSSADPTVHRLTWSNDWQTRLRRRLRRRRLCRDAAPYIASRPGGFEMFSDDRSDCGPEIIAQLPPCDIINLHWVTEYLDYQWFFSHLPKRTPLVWRLADMAALTGGCHYDHGCGKFAQQCGACPQLGSTNSRDLSHQVWLRKNSSLHYAQGRLHIVGTSRWIIEQVKRSSLLASFPMSIIPNGLDTEVFAPRDRNFARQSLGLPPQAKVVLFVADSAAVRRKGFDYLAKALTQIDNIPGLHLVAVGGGKPAVPGIPLLHLGKITQDRLLSIVYSAADVFVIPSLQESFGQTVIEAMACGTPVAGFDTGGIPDMVRPGQTGCLAKVEDAAALAGAIRGILCDPPAQTAMSANCRRIAVAEYALPVQARAYEQLYQTILGAN